MREITAAGLNTGVLNSASATIDVSDISHLVVNVVQASGNIAGAVITVEQSLDGSTWFTTGITISGATLSAVVTLCTKYMRLRVSTASGAASTANCTIQGKPADMSYATSALTKARTDMNAFGKVLSQFSEKLTSIQAIVAKLEKR